MLLEIKSILGALPTCASCKKIRKSDGDPQNQRAHGYRWRGSSPPAPKMISLMVFARTACCDSIRIFAGWRNYRLSHYAGRSGMRSGIVDDHLGQLIPAIK
jgi:hypothetical protein